MAFHALSASATLTPFRREGASSRSERAALFSRRNATDLSFFTTTNRFCSIVLGAIGGTRGGGEGGRILNTSERDSSLSSSSPLYTWPDKQKPRVCILGGGFGGLYTALRLESLVWPDDKKPQVLLVDQSERFVFKPMLYELLSGEKIVLPTGLQAWVWLSEEQGRDIHRYSLVVSESYWRSKIHTQRSEIQSQVMTSLLTSRVSLSLSLQMEGLV